MFFLKSTLIKKFYDKMLVFNLLILVLLPRFVELWLCKLPLTTKIVSFWLLNALDIVCCFYMKKSARYNGRNVVLQVFLKKYITPYVVFVKVQHASDCARRTDEF